MTVRRLAAAAALVSLPLAASACGGSKSGTTTTTTTNAAPTVSDAVAKTVKAGSEHIAVTASVKASSQTVTLTGSGDFDAKRRQGTLHATVGLGGVQTSIDEVLTGDTAYVQSQLLSSLLPSGKTWLKIDLGAAGKALGIDTSVLAAQDPAAALAQLKALRGLHQVGTGTVDGTQATHYRGTIDVAKLPAGGAGALSTAGAKLGPVDVWVGSDGYVRRIRLSTTTAGTGTATKTLVTTTLSKFGEGVLVSVPAASETVDASKVHIPGIGG